MSDNRNGQNGEVEQEYEYFPYKSYEERNAENRRYAVRRGLAAMGGLFLLLVAVVVGIGIWMGGSPLQWWDQLQREGSEDPVQGVTQGSVQPGAADPGSAPLADPSASEQGVLDPETPGLALEPGTTEGPRVNALYVKDVSLIVERAQLSVVGVTTESYSNFSYTSSGSGIILSEDGYIVTNNHVISDGGSISVTLSSGDVCPAYVIGSDEYTDIAVLKISAEGLTPATLGDSDSAAVGEAAIAIGNPTGQLLGTATAGIISGVNRNVMVNNTMMNLLQTDAAINAGNSGGPLLNQYGEVIGVTSVKVSMTGYEGLGFAIPINTVIPIVENLVENGYVTGRPLVGVAGTDLSYMASRFYGFPQGVYVVGVASDADVWEQGLRQGDIITAVDGKSVTGVSEACILRDQYAPGEQLSLTYYRKGTYYDLTLTLGEQTDQSGNYNF